MTDDELRVLVREAIRRHVRPDAGPADRAGVLAGPAASGERPLARPHASHLLMTVPSGSDDQGRCGIEPSERCHQCGYCRSLGY